MLTKDNLEAALKDLGLAVESDGTHFVHTTRGRYAPLINTIITLDEDSSGATVIATLADFIEEAQRPVAYELLNLVHGQSLWNVRFHLDEEGRILSIGKFSLWGRPMNPVQLGDVIFSLMVSMDRLWPCVDAIRRGAKNAQDAFALFFLKSGPQREDT